MKKATADLMSYKKEGVGVGGKHLKPGVSLYTVQ